MPITALHRTLLDLAETLPSRGFRSVFEEADRRDLIDFDALRACMACNPGRRGLKPLGRLLGDYLPVDGAGEGIATEFERFLVEEGFPRPLTEVLVAGQIVDCFWPGFGLLVELDSRGYHRHWEQHERDRARRRRAASGPRSLRVTHRRLTREREELIADLASVLSRRPQ